MPNSIWAPDIQKTLAGARTAARAPFPSPEDWRDKVMYFLLVDRFNNTAAPPRVMPYDTPVNAFQGGTFAGVQAAIPYLQQLGIGAVWLSPVLANCPFSPDVYHGYGIHDFLRAEPRFATNPDNADAELRALVDALHDAGLHVIFDMVLNHTGDVFAYAPNASDPLNTSTSGTEASFSPTPLPVQWRDAQGHAQEGWPVLEQISDPPQGGVVWPVELQRNEYFRRQGTIPNWQTTAGDFMALKQILTTDPAMQDVLIRVYQHVIAKFDADGFRIDTMKYLQPSFARTFCQCRPRVLPQHRQEELLHLRRGVRHQRQPDCDLCRPQRHGPGRPRGRGCGPGFPAGLLAAQHDEGAGGALDGGLGVPDAQDGRGRHPQHARRRQRVLRDVSGQPRSQEPLLLRQPLVA